MILGKGRFGVSIRTVAQGVNFVARREEKQILLPQGGIRMTCHSERSEESAFGCGYAALYYFSQTSCRRAKISSRTN